MTMIDAITDPEKAASKLGTEHGKALASWVEIESSEHAARILAMFDDCDPIVWDSYGAPLSGEYADGYTVTELFADCGVEFSADEFLTEAVIEAYETAHASAWEDSVCETARYYL